MSLSAVSFASEPELEKKTLLRWRGACAASLSASRMVGSVVVLKNDG